jgi:hypothetical protein
MKRASSARGEKRLPILQAPFIFPFSINGEITVVQFGKDTHLKEFEKGISFLKVRYNVAEALAPLGAAEKSQFLRPATKGWIYFSTRWLSIGR